MRNSIGRIIASVACTLRFLYTPEFLVARAYTWATQLSMPWILRFLYTPEF